MRATNDDFQQEVFRRSKVYKQKQAIRRKQITAGVFTLCIAFGAFGVWKMGSVNRASSMLYEGTAKSDETGKDTNGIAAEQAENAEGNHMTDTAGAVLGGDRLQNQYGKLNGAKSLAQFLLETENGVLAPDAKDITVKITNHGMQPAAVSYDEFCIAYTAADGTGMMYLWHTDENSTPESVNIAAQESAEMTLAFADFGFGETLPAGEYNLELQGIDCNPAEFKVEVD